MDLFYFNEIVLNQDLTLNKSAASLNIRNENIQYFHKYSLAWIWLLHAGFHFLVCELKWFVLYKAYLRHCQTKLRAPASRTSGSTVQSQWCEVMGSTQGVTAEEGRATTERLPMQSARLEGRGRGRGRLRWPNLVWSLVVWCSSLYASDLQKEKKKKRENRCKTKKY